MVVFECIPEANNVFCCLSYKTGISILLVLAIAFEIPANLLLVYLVKDFSNQTKCIITYMYVLGIVLISIEMLSVCCMCTFPYRITSKFFMVFSILRIICFLFVVVYLGANLKVYAIIGYVNLMLLWGYICYLANSFYPKDCQHSKETYYMARHVEDGLDSVNRNKPETPEKYRAPNPVVYSCASLVNSIENASLYWMDKAAKSKNVRKYRALKHDMAEKSKKSKAGSPKYISESATSKECANVTIFDQSAASSAPNEYWKHRKSDKLQKFSKRDKMIKFRKSYNIGGKKAGKKAKCKKLFNSVKCSKRISWLFWMSEKYKLRNCKKRTTQNLGVPCKKDTYSGLEAPQRVTELYESFASSGEDCLNKIFQQHDSCECSSPKSKKCPKPKKPPKPKKEKKKKCKPVKPVVSSTSIMCSPQKGSSGTTCPGCNKKSKVKPGVVCKHEIIGQPKIQYSSKKKKRAVKHRLICIGPANDSKQKVNVQLKIEIDEPEATQDVQCGGECIEKKESSDCKCVKPVKKSSKASKLKVNKSSSCKSIQNNCDKQAKEIQYDGSVAGRKKTSQKSCGDTKVEIGTQKRSTECECDQGQPETSSPTSIKLKTKKKEKVSSSSCLCNKLKCEGGCGSFLVCKLSNKCLSADIKGKKNNECDCDMPAKPNSPELSPKSSGIKLTITKNCCPCRQFTINPPGAKLASKTGGPRLAPKLCKSKSSKSQKSDKSSQKSSCNKTSKCKKKSSPKTSKSKVKKVKSDKCKIKKVKSDKCKIKKSKSSKRSNWLCQGIQTKCKKIKNIANMGIQCGMGSGCGVLAPCLMDKQCGKDADPGMAIQCAQSSTIMRNRIVTGRSHHKKDTGIACASYGYQHSLDEMRLDQGIDLTTLCSQDGMRGNMCIVMLDKEEETDRNSKIFIDDVSRARSDVQDLKNAVMGDWSRQGAVTKVKESQVCVLHQTNQSQVKQHGFRTTSYLTSKILRRKQLLRKDKSNVNLHGLHLISWTKGKEEPQRRPKSGGSEKQATNTKNQT